jgi:hypothetical protein
MTIADLIIILTNSLIRLNNDRHTAFVLGHVEQVIELDRTIEETRISLQALQSLQ